MQNWHFQRAEICVIAVTTRTHFCVLGYHVSKHVWAYRCAELIVLPRNSLSGCFTPPAILRLPSS